MLLIIEIVAIINNFIDATRCGEGGRGEGEGEIVDLLGMHKAKIKAEGKRHDLPAMCICI